MRQNHSHTRIQQTIAATSLLAASLFISCNHTPTVPALAQPATPTASTTPLGHFRLKLLTTHVITPSNTPVGSRTVDLKAYPSIVATQADFYLPEGARSEGIAALSDGHTLLLQFVDLKLTEDHAESRQYLFDGDFHVQSIFGTSRSWPYASSAIFRKDKPQRDRIFELANVIGEVEIVARNEFELTYLGLTTAQALVQKTPESAAINCIPTDFKTTIEADARTLSAGIRNKNR